MISKDNFVDKLGLSEDDLDNLCDAFDENTGEIDLTQLPTGLQNLIDGYIEYAKEVIINRALPDIDGLKPVHRRILYTMFSEKIKSKMKCSRIAGNVLKFHPHGDAPVYEAMARMTDRNGTFAIPLVEGQGTFGKVYSDAKPADKRYTEACLHKNAFDYYFKDLSGVEFMPSFDGEDSEPVLLKSELPMILCNNSQGIAVGFSCNIPSFNFNDVIDISIEYGETGSCKTVISPDFPSGGYYIKNDKELMKIMQTGKGKLKLRGRVEIEGKYINIKEFPFGSTVQGILKQIDKKNVNWVKNASDYSDYKGACLAVECTAKTRVDEVLYSLYKDTSLQDTFQVDMTIIRDGRPVRVGVWGIVAEWFKVTRQQLTKEYNLKLESCIEKAKYARALMEIINHPEKRDALVDIITHKSDYDAMDYLEANFDNELVLPETREWVVNRRTKEFRDGGKYLTQYENLQKEISNCKGILENLDAHIVSELKKLKARDSSKYPRRTEITSTDYDFSAKENQAEISLDKTDCVYFIKDGFLRKERDLGLDYTPKDSSVLVVKASASDTLIGFDNEGRVLRVYCEHIPYSGANELGIYLPRYFGFESVDGYKVMHMWLLDGSTKMLVFNDGNVGFLDTSEWVGTQRQVKVVEKGVSPKSGLVGYVANVPDCILVSDTSGKLAWQLVSDLKVKERKARTKAFDLEANATIDEVAFLTNVQLAGFLLDISKYNGKKLKELESLEDITGDMDFLKPMKL